MECFLTFILPFSLQYALKIEKSRDVRTVKSELKVLQQLKGCRYVCKLYDSGSENGLHFFVMQLLGRNLAETIQRDYGRCAPLTDVKILATGLLNALEGFHKEGFIHRDVKPANFALEDSTTSAKDGSWMLIDFGLARLYLNEKNEVLPPRQDAGFRGSTTYASLNAHEDKDLGRRDDLWSWFYVLVEMIEGTLPWRVDRGEITGAITTPAAAAATSGNGNLTAKESVEERKKECISHPERLFSKAFPIPPVIKEINEYIAKLEFGDKPNYSYLRILLGRLDGESLVAVSGKEKKELAVPPTHHQDDNHNQNDRSLDKDATNGVIKSTPTRAPLVVDPRSRSLERKIENDRKSQRRETDRSRDRDKNKSKDRFRRNRSRSRAYSSSRSRSRSRLRSRSRSHNGRDRGRRRSPSRSSSRGRRHSRNSGRLGRSRSRSRTRSRSRSRSPARGNNKNRRSGGSDRKNCSDGNGNGKNKTEDIVLVNAQKKFQNTMEFIGMLRSVSFLGLVD